MDRANVDRFLERHRQAVLATTRKDGRAQLSNVLAVLHEGSLLISTSVKRAKYRNLTRDPRATLCIMGDSFWQYLVIDGQAKFTHLPEAREGLRLYYELASGPHPNWEEYDRAMEEEQRVLVSVSVDSFYGFNV